MASKRPRSARALARAVERGERAVDALMGRMASEVGAGVVRAIGAEDRAVTAGDYAAVMVEVDRALARVYGPRKGERSALGEMITRETARTRRRVATEAVAAIEPAIRARDPLLLVEIERTARED